MVAAGLLLVGTAIGVIIANQADLAPWALGVGCLAFALAAIVSIRPVRIRLPWLRTKDDRDDLLRVYIGKQLGTLRDFQLELAPLTNEEDVLKGIEARVVAWTTTVRNQLDVDRPGWGELFLTDPISMQYSTQYGHRDRIRNWLAQRQAAMRQMLTMLG